MLYDVYVQAADQHSGLRLMRRQMQVWKVYQ
jgi:hypothetical protein